MKQCDNGHYYDETRYESCPYCQQSNVGKTVAAGPASIGKTVGIAAGSPAPGSVHDSGKTVGIIHKQIGIDPAVGFLVVIDGPHKGADFKLVAGRNFLGRSASMDISLPDDDMISRENHAVITYDARHNGFSLAPGQSRGLTYCNDDPVEGSRAIEAYDIIEIGGSKILFLPLCGEKFQWSAEE